MPARIDFTRLDLMDALDLAILIETEAEERYEMFASQLGYRRAGDAADVFRSMARNEARHAAELIERRQQRFGDAPMRVRRDDLFDVEAPEHGAPRSGMSPLRAFQVALVSEQKAWAFYDEALGHVREPDVRDLFLGLRDEETEHVGLVERAIAALPPDAAWDEADEDESPML